MTFIITNELNDKIKQICYDYVEIFLENEKHRYISVRTLSSIY